MKKEKIQEEVEKIKLQGLESYVKTRKTKINVLGVIGIAAIAFLLGAVIF